MVDSEGDVVFWVPVLGCDADCEAFITEEVVNYWGYGTPILDHKRAILVIVRISSLICWLNSRMVYSLVDRSPPAYQPPEEPGRSRSFWR